MVLKIQGKLRTRSFFKKNDWIGNKLCHLMFP